MQLLTNYQPFFFHLYLPGLDVYLIHTDFAQLQFLKMKKTQSATTDMGASGYTGRSQKHNCNEQHPKSDKVMLFCMSGLTIWMNWKTGRSQGSGWMVTPGEAKVGFSKVLRDFFFQ